MKKASSILLIALVVVAPALFVNLSRAASEPVAKGKKGKSVEHFSVKGSIRTVDAAAAKALRVRLVQMVKDLEKDRVPIVGHEFKSILSYYFACSVKVTLEDPGAIHIQKTFVTIARMAREYPSFSLTFHLEKTPHR